MRSHKTNVTKIQAAPNRAAIALGSNLGDSRSTLEQALQTLAQMPAVTLLAQSHWYQTKPVGPPQPDYINGCAVVQTQLDPEQLLETLLEIENQYGRVRAQRWGARTLDLDLILFGDRVIDTLKLQLPHPRMGERAFVLRPLADIAPDWVDPMTHCTIAQLLAQVSCADLHPLAATPSKN
jgi:2-amino-4-hydroxy-6-hydroxymethyldihydropteridine diphosphokinase